MRFILLVVALAGSAGCVAEDDAVRVTSIYAPELGGPVQGLPEAEAAAFERGKAIFERAFTPSEGLGPRYNAESCVACHFFPVPGGAASRFRDVHLLQTADGADRGTDDGPLRKLYSVESGHDPEPPGATVFARRAPLSTLGVGLFSFVPDEEILSRADPDDADGDGISGRAHAVDGGLGRFGYKAQAATLEAVVRSAFREQLGLTSPVVDAVPPQVADVGWIGAAHAHPHNPQEAPGTDGDSIGDPELAPDDVRDLVSFLTWLAPPPPSGTNAPQDAIDQGEELFGRIGCARCHVPTLDTPMGPIPAYTDLLLHDMGDGLGPDVAVGDASPTEIRTTPLLAPRLHVPYLHDSSAPAYEFTMLAHGGEAAASAAAYRALDDEGRLVIQLFLDSLGGWNPKGRFLAREGEPIPPVGEAGGPTRELSSWERDLWIQGRQKFDRMTAPSFDSGLGTFFNADTCRGCHFAPVIGGAGGNDVNVLIVDGDRAGEADIEWPLGEGTLPRSAITRIHPFAMPPSASVVEARNTPTLLGIGLLDDVPAAAILARHDPNDADGDGVTGRVRILPDGRLGRFGWKANVPSVVDFIAGALRGELSITVDPRFTGYTSPDDGDWFPDPEVNDNTLIEEGFYLRHLGPPPRRIEDEALVQRGEAVFGELGCTGCHTPSLGGVAAYTDLLLHDIAPQDAPVANREFGVLPTEYRTPPLWGLRDTAPYLHDGSAESPEEAVLNGHHGEAQAARQAFGAADVNDRVALGEFLRSL